MSNTPPSDIVDEAGTLLRLGTVLGQGGEGAVWDIPSMPTMVAKVYHKPLSPERADKIRAMAKIGTPALSRLTAWPERVLFRKSGPAIGLMIPKIADAKDIHKLYSPKSRRTEFQRADWRFLVHTAANTSRAFAAVHEAGHVIGDVNHGSVLVAQDATVRLVDCDSFQVTTGGRQFLCDKGVETFTPPELQGKTLSGIVRTSNHDNFGLAVLVFQLLFLGRHPFAGRFSGKGDMPISLAIKEIRFPYGSRAASMQMSRPPGTPTLFTAGREVEQLFERAFARETIDHGRPTARDWIGTLEALEKKSRKQCGVQKSHWFPVHLAQCPWCEMEKATGATLFPYVFQAQTVGKSSVDIQTLFKRVDTLSIPAELHPTAVTGVSPSAAALAVPIPKTVEIPAATDKALLQVFAGGFFLVLLFGLPTSAKLLAFLLPALSYWVISSDMDKRHTAKVDLIQGPFRAEISNLEDAVKRLDTATTGARTMVDQAIAEWKQKAEMPDLLTRKEQLRKLKSEHDRIPEKRRSELNKLEGRRRSLQMARHLERYRIIDATIDGVGRERKLILESYGIENADDVTSYKLAAVPGFGPKLTKTMLMWRLGAEARFVFDPRQGVDPTATAAVEQAILAERVRLEKQMEVQANEVLRDFQVVMESRSRLRTRISGLQTAYAHAKADREHVAAALRALNVPAPVVSRTYWTRRKP